VKLFEGSWDQSALPLFEELYMYTCIYAIQVCRVEYRITLLERLNDMTEQTLLLSIPIGTYFAKYAP
jgi:hypothetical protein